MVEDAEYWKHKAYQMALIAKLLIQDAHPVYGSTAKWRGGIGGAAMTAHCSINEGPPPGLGWIIDAAYSEVSDLTLLLSAEETKNLERELKEKYDGSS